MEASNKIYTIHRNSHIKIPHKCLDSGHTHTHTEKAVAFCFGYIAIINGGSGSQEHRKIYVCAFRGRKFLMAKWTQHPEYYLRFHQQVVDFMGHNYSAWFRRFYSHLLLVYEIGVVPRHKARLIRDTPLNKPVHFLISAQFFRVACRRRHCWQTLDRNFEMLEFKSCACM